MLNAIKVQNNYGLNDGKNRKWAKYEFMSAELIAQEMYASLLNASYTGEFWEKFDSIPQHKIGAVLKNYGNTKECGLLTDMYVNLGISIRDLKPRVLRIINLVSFKDKEKRAIWKLYGEFNDFDDFLEEHNAVIVKKIDNLLLQIS